MVDFGGYNSYEEMKYGRDSSEAIAAATSAAKSGAIRTKQAEVKKLALAARTKRNRENKTRTFLKISCRDPTQNEIDAQARTICEGYLEKISTTETLELKPTDPCFDGLVKVKIETPHGFYNHAWCKSGDVEALQTKNLQYTVELTGLDLILQFSRI